MANKLPQFRARHGASKCRKRELKLLKFILGEFENDNAKTKQTATKTAKKPDGINPNLSVGDRPRRRRQTRSGKQTPPVQSDRDRRE